MVGEKRKFTGEIAGKRKFIETHPKISNYTRSFSKIKHKGKWHNVIPFFAISIPLTILKIPLLYFQLPFPCSTLKFIQETASFQPNITAHLTTRFFFYHHYFSDFLYLRYFKVMFP